LRLKNKKYLDKNIFFVILKYYLKGKSSNNTN